MPGEPATWLDPTRRKTVVRLYTIGMAKDHPDMTYVSIIQAKDTSSRLKLPWTVD